MTSSQPSNTPAADLSLVPHHHPKPRQGVARSRSSSRRPGLSIPATRRSRWSVPLLLVVLVGTATTAAGLSGCVESRLRQNDKRDEAARTYVGIGDELRQAGMLKEALESYESALAVNPRVTAAHMGIGSVYRQTGDLTKAKSAYFNATQIEPDNFDANYYLGLMRQLTGEVTAAISSYLRALAINPDSIDANRDVASAYMQLGRAQEARYYAKRATELDPDSQPAWANLAAVYSLVGEYEQAVLAYRVAAELGELAPPVLLGLADAHIRLDNFRRAINVLERLIADYPTSTAYERLGYAQFKLRDFETALSSFRTAIELDTTEVGAHNGIGVCLMTLYVEGGRENDYQRKQALAAWQRSLQINLNQPKIVDLVARYGQF